ncbi:MAG: phosphoglycerate kinase [Candidatus Shapirobacteria bacterium]|nr:phosphoglycerate kinase [Candidatus Shapirobacteria bacterium]
MIVKKLKSIELIPKANGKEAVLLRMDLDLDVPGPDYSRLIKSVPTIKILIEKGYIVIITGHKGRPKNQEEKFSLKPAYSKLIEILTTNGIEGNSTFIKSITDKESIIQALLTNKIIFAENLRFDSREKAGDTSLLSIVKLFCSYYVNDAFAVAHRNDASIKIHQEFGAKTYYGLDFVKEVERINFLKQQKGWLVALGGAKEDKLKNLVEIASKSQAVFIGGKLPTYKETFGKIPNVFWANLNEDGCDLSNDDISTLKTLITLCPTIIWAGALGKFEEDRYKNGTNEIANAIAESHATYKAIAGGDTAASVIDLELESYIDDIYSGGGVFLELLVTDDLPAWTNSL